MKWKASPQLRKKFIEEIFAAGYGNKEDRETSPLRWTPEEMESECDDMGLLSLWLRYVTYYPDPQKLKTKYELEFLASIAATDFIS